MLLILCFYSIGAFSYSSSVADTDNTWCEVPIRIPLSFVRPTLIQRTTRLSTISKSFKQTEKMLTKSNCTHFLQHHGRITDTDLKWYGQLFSNVNAGFGGLPNLVGLQNVSRNFCKMYWSYSGRYLLQQIGNIAWTSSGNFPSVYLNYWVELHETVQAVSLKQTGQITWTSSGDLPERFRSSSGSGDLPECSSVPVWDELVQVIHLKVQVI